MKDKKVIIIVVIVLVLLGLGVYFLVSKDSKKEVDTKKEKTEEKVENKMYYNEKEDTYYDGKGNYYKSTETDGMYYNEETNTYMQIKKQYK